MFMKCFGTYYLKCYNNCHIYLFNILSYEGAWPMELDNMWCLTEHGNDWEPTVGSQLDCQDICLKNPACVGISYSYRAGMSNTCFVCTTVPMNGFHRNSFGFAFYRAPGKVFLITKHQIL